MSKLEPGGNRWKGKTQMISGTSSAGWFDINEPGTVLWIGYMEEIVCSIDDVLIFKFQLIVMLTTCNNNYHYYQL